MGCMAVACLVLGYGTLRKEHPDWGLPKLDPGNVTYNIFRLSVFAMSMVLSVRLGRGYDRW